MYDVRVSKKEFFEATIIKIERYWEELKVSCLESVGRVEKKR